MGPRHSAEVKNPEEEEWYLKYFKERPRAGMYLNVPPFSNAQLQPPLVPLKTLEIDAVIQDSMCEMNLI